MIKAFGLVLGIQALAAGVVIAQDKETEKNGLSGHQVVVGAGAIATTTGAGLARLNFEKMFEIYQRNSIKAFSTNELNGVLLRGREIQDIARDVRAGDEVRITYRTSELEERQVRISQIEKRTKEIERELQRLRLRVVTSSSSNPMQAHSLAMQMRDNNVILGLLKNQITDLQSGATRIDTRTATSVVDMRSYTAKELEMFLMQKSRLGKNVLVIERIPRAARLEVAQIQKLMRGQIVVALIGGVILVEELASGILGDSADNLLNSKVYVPELKTSQ